MRTARAGFGLEPSHRRRFSRLSNFLARSGEAAAPGSGILLPYRRPRGVVHDGRAAAQADAKARAARNDLLTRRRTTESHQPTTQPTQERTGPGCRRYGLTAGEGMAAPSEGTWAELRPTGAVREFLMSSPHRVGRFFIFIFSKSFFT